MREWRATRLDELARMKSEVTTKRRSPSKRKYGGLVAVDAVGYLDAVEKVSAGTIVVVLIYDHEVCKPSSRRSWPIGATDVGCSRKIAPRWRMRSTGSHTSMPPHGS